MKRAIAGGVLVFLANMAMADSWTTPAKGSVVRAALMDALRPQAEWMLGKPVEFVVRDLRVAGNVAFAAVQPQRPGGGPIDPAKTPMAGRGEYQADDLDGVHMEALYQKSGETWVAVHWHLGATDVWYAWDAYCAEYRAVIPEVCP